MGRRVSCSAAAARRRRRCVRSRIGGMPISWLKRCAGAERDRPAGDAGGPVDASLVHRAFVQCIGCAADMRVAQVRREPADLTSRQWGDVAADRLEGHSRLTSHSAVEKRHAGMTAR